MCVRVVVMVADMVVQRDSEDTCVEEAASWRRTPEFPDMASKTMRAPCQGHHHHLRSCKMDSYACLYLILSKLYYLAFEMSPVSLAGALSCGSVSYKPRPTQK